MNWSTLHEHEKEAVQRPDVGIEAQFSNKKAPKTYRYDSSLSPELAWDENGAQLCGVVAQSSGRTMTFTPSFFNLAKIPASSRQGH
jgi:hypothetical protein